MNQPLLTNEGKPVSFAREQRLLTIDKLIAHQGFVNRSAIIDKHRVVPSTAMQDIKLYNSLTPQVNAVYNFSTKRYERTETFSPLFPDEVKA